MRRRDETVGGDVWRGWVEGGQRIERERIVGSMEKGGRERKEEGGGGGR